MIWFRDFTVPLWLIFVGNVLFLITCLFYLGWWGLAFGSDGYNGLSSIVLVLTLGSGVAALAFLILGVNSLATPHFGLHSMIIFTVAVAGYFLLQGMAEGVFHRGTTSELFLIVVWVTVQTLVVSALHTSGRFAPGPTIATTVLLAIATIVGLICYLVFFHLDEPGQYRIGFVPIAVDAGVEIVLLGLLGVIHPGPKPTPPVQSATPPP